jgi:hypothetical protein
LTGPPPINIDFGNDATGGSASNALFVHSLERRFQVKPLFELEFNELSAQLL